MIYKALAVWLVIQVPMGLLVGLMIRQGSVAEPNEQEDALVLSLAADTPITSMPAASSR